MFCQIKQTYIAQRTLKKKDNVKSRKKVEIFHHITVCHLPIISLTPVLWQSLIHLLFSLFFRLSRQIKELLNLLIALLLLLIRRFLILGILLLFLLLFLLLVVIFLFFVVLLVRILIFLELLLAKSKVIAGLFVIRILAT